MGRSDRHVRASQDGRAISRHGMTSQMHGLHGLVEGNQDDDGDDGEDGLTKANMVKVNKGD